MLEFVDARTVFVLSGIFSAIMAIVFYAIHRGVENVVDGVTAFAWAFFCYTLFAFLLLFRDELPAFAGIVLADTLFCTALLFIVCGFHRLKGMTFQQKWFYVYPLLCLFLFSCFTFLYPSFIGRVVISSICIVTTFCWILSHLLRAPLHEFKLGSAILTFSLLLAVLSATVQLGIDLNNAHDDLSMSILAYHGIQAQYLIMQLLSTIFIAVGLMIMTQDILREDLEILASHDMLTGLLTRRVIVDTMNKTLACLNRHQKPLSVMLLDIDHFKSINDRYGHCIGDLVLKNIAWKMQRVIRPDCYLGRYGGEEFLVVMPNTSEAELMQLAQRILNAVAETHVMHDEECIRCTVSIGAMSMTAADHEWIANPIRYADEALYQAKSQGRNCVVQAQHNFVAQAVA